MNSSCSNTIQRSFAVTLIGIIPAFLGSDLLAQTCTVSASTGIPDSTFNAEYTENAPGTGEEPPGMPGWTGADSTYSVQLPNGDSAFFFSDSYIGEYPEVSGDGTVTTNSNRLRTRAVNCGAPLRNPPTSLYHAHNSIVVQSAKTGQLSTLVGPKDLTSGYSTSYFASATGAITGHFHWTGNSVVVQVDSLGTKKLWTFVLERDSFNCYGSAIAQLSLPDLTIDSITPLSNVPSGNVLHWGTALWLDGTYGNCYLYVYGIEDNGQSGRYPFIALTNPALGVSGITDTNNRYVWNGNSWVTGLTNAVQIIGAPNDPNNAGNHVSSEYSVKKVHSSAGTTYLLVAQNTKVAFGTWKDIVLYSACRPQGPFTGKQVVYSTPETGATNVPAMTSSHSLSGILLTYNPHAHLQFTSNGPLLISYDLNAGNSVDLIYADVSSKVYSRENSGVEMKYDAFVGQNTTTSAGNQPPWSPKGHIEFLRGLLALVFIHS